MKQVLALPYDYKIVRRSFVGDYGIVMVEKLSGLAPMSPRFYTYRINDDHTTPDGKFTYEFGRYYVLHDEAIVSFVERTRELLHAVIGPEGT